MKNLRKEFKKIQVKSSAGMINAAIIVRRDMDRTPPLIPVDKGILRSSWFVTSSRGVQEAGEGEGRHGQVVAETTARAKSQAPARFVVIMGFSAIYAVEVHEATGKVFKRPGAGPKFLESSLKRNKSNILRAVAGATKF